jgi:hypothetical protein
MDNPFKVGDTVHYATKINGVVANLSCFAATRAGGNTCKKDTCYHTDKDYVWVDWPHHSQCNYHYKELMPERMHEAIKHFKRKIELDELDWDMGKGLLNG